MIRKSLIVFLCGLMSGVMMAQEAPATVNLTRECVTEYDPSVDYFPQKTEVTDAVNFNVSYYNHYKVVTVLNAYDSAEPFQYVLVQCGTPAPDSADFPEGTQFVDVPVSSIITMSTTQLPHLSDLGLLDRLVGLDSFLYVNSPEVQNLIADGDLIEVGSGSSVNVEMVLDLEPDVVMTYGFNPDFDAHPKLIEAGIFTALNAEWREDTPLARAEWIKYTGLFFNAEAASEAVYDEIVTAYQSLIDLVAGVPLDERKVVLMNAFSSFDNAWNIPGAQTFVGTLVRDAGGIIALGEQAPNTSVQVSIETVYDEALNAEIWVTGLFAVSTIEELLAQDSRYADFAAVANGEVWNNDLDINENGGSNYYELGVTNPHLILADLVAIFYPELLPDHTFAFHRRLESSGQ